MKKQNEKETDIQLLLQENGELKEELAELKQQLTTMKKLIFGQKSEKTEYIADGQISLFNEAECEESRKARAEENPVVVAEHTRKAKRTHDELAKDLPVEEVVYTVPEEERECDRCSAEMQTVGKEFIRDELVFVPAKLFVRKHYAEVLKCSECGNNESRDAQKPDIEKTSFKKAAVPAPMIPHSFCSPELLAHIAYEKYINGMPLYRQEKDFAAKDVSLSRTTMANWIMYAAKEWLRPLFEQIKSDLLEHKVIHADETVVQVLNEPGKKAKSESRMWVYCAGEIGCKDSILFEYQPTRNGDHAKKFLNGFTGHLVTDGYSGYGKLTDVTRCGCWAHLRRKFIEALPDDKEAAKTSNAAKAIEYIDRLFELERNCKTDEDRQKQRQKSEKTLIDEFYTWLETLNPAGSGLSKAVGYALSQKKYLKAYLDNPSVPLSNNRAENAIRPFCIGRKNWLFSNSVKGAEASALFYSIASTAKANGLNIEQYFTKLFKTIPNTKFSTKELLHLLPYKD